MSATVFLSSVSSEFGELRHRLAVLARRTQRVHVRHQDDFNERGVLTLQRLEEEIEASDAVFHVIGREEGSRPPVGQIEAVLNRHKDFETRFPEIVAAGRNGQVSYTQWEAWLAIYFSKRLCNFFRNYSNSGSTPNSPDSTVISRSQYSHWEQLNQIKYYPKTVTTDEQLYDEMVLSLIDLGILTQKEILTESPPTSETVTHAALVNPFAGFDTFCTPELFVGRRVEIASAIQTLRSTIFLGEAKTGKSNLLIRIREQLMTTGLHAYPVFALYLSPNSEPFKSASDVFQRIYRFLTAKVQETIGVTPSSSEGPEYVGKILAVLADCEAKNRKLRLVLLLDDLDVFALQIPNKVQLIQNLRELIDGSPIDQHVAVMATSKPDFMVAEDNITSSLVSRLLPPVYLTAFSLEECIQYASNAKSAIPQNELTPEFYQRIYGATGGNPFLLWTLMFRVTEQVLRHKSKAESSLREFEDNPVLFWPLFKRWLTNLTVDELSYLIAVANDINTNEWPLEQSSVDRFLSMGVIPPLIAEAASQEKVCTLFYSWMKSNSRRLFPASKRSVSVVNNAERVAQLLHITLKQAIGNNRPRDDGTVKKCVQAILAAHQLEFETGSGEDDTDFSISSLNTIVCVGLVKVRNATSFIEKFRERIATLSKKPQHLICVCYDLSGKVTSQALNCPSDRTNVQYVVVNHQ